MSKTRLDRERYVLGDPSDHVGFLNCERIADRSHIHGWSVEAHYHEGLTQLFIFDTGRVICRIDFAPHKIEGPAMVWLPALCSHAFEYQVDMKGWVITVPTSDISRMAAETVWLDRWVHQPHLITGPQHHERLSDAIRLAKRIEAEHCGFEEDRSLALESLFRLLLISINRGIGAEVETGANITPQSQKLFNRFRALLDEQIVFTRSVSSYAELLSVTPTHLTRTVKMVSGQTAGEIISDRIMLEAKRKLTFADLPVAEIAYALKFSSTSYFSRFFSAHAGETPKDFRKKMRDSFRNS